MRLPSGSFNRTVRAALTSGGIGIQTLLTSVRRVGGDAVCEEVGIDLLDRFKEEAEASLVRIRETLRGGGRAWSRLLEASLTGIVDAGSAIAIRSAREALSAGAAYAVEFAHRKAYAVAAVVDMAMGIPETFEQALMAETHAKALLHIHAFREAIAAIRDHVSAITRAVAVFQHEEGETRETAGTTFDFARILRDLRVAEVSLGQDPPAANQARDLLDAALYLMATGRDGRGGAAELDALLAIFSSQDAAEEFFSLPDGNVIDLIERAVDAAVVQPIEAAYVSAQLLPDLIEVAATEYGAALQWTSRLRSTEQVVALTRRALAGARTGFFNARSLASLRTVIAEIDAFDDSAHEVHQVATFRFRQANALFNIRAGITAFQGENAVALEQIRTQQPVVTGPDGIPELFRERGQQRVSYLEVILRLLLASVGRVTGQEERGAAVLSILDEADALAADALEALGPAPDTPPMWTTVRRLMNEAGVERPLDEIFSGEFATRAIDSYRTLTTGWEQVSDIVRESRRKPQVPCAPKQLAAAPALAERVVGLRISRERIDQIRSTTSLDAIDASRRINEARLFALDQLVGLAGQSPSPPPA